MTAVLEAVAERLETSDESTIRIPEICEATGVNYGSVYHHFGSREGVIDAAYEKIFTRLVEEDLELLHGVNLAATSFDQYVAAMAPLIDVMAHGDERRARRALRLRVVAVSHTRPHLRALIAQAQAGLTDELADIVRYGQVRHWLRDDLSAQSIAVMTLALIFGRNLEDVSARPISDAEWSAAMMVIVSDVLHLSAGPESR